MLLWPSCCWKKPTFFLLKERQHLICSKQSCFNPPRFSFQELCFKKHNGVRRVFTLVIYRVNPLVSILCYLTNYLCEWVNINVGRFFHPMLVLCQIFSQFYVDITYENHFIKEEPLILELLYSNLAPTQEFF
jgi:hypothetical protein